MKRRRIAILYSFFRHGQWRGIMRYGQKAGWICQRFSAADLDRLGQWNADGILYQIDEFDDRLLDFLQQYRGPTVGLRAAAGMEDKGPLVLPDLSEIGKEVAKHFVGNNYQRLCYIGPKVDGTANAGSTHYRGMLEVSQQYGTKLEAFYPDTSSSWEQLGLEPPTQSSADWERFWKFGTTLITHLKSYKQPVGLMSAFMEPAMKLLDIASDHGSGIPSDFGLVAQTEDSLTGTVTRIPLSTIAPNYGVQGFEAGKLLDRILDGEGIPRDFRRLISDFRFDVRESSDQMVSVDPQVNTMINFIRENADCVDLTPDLIADKMGCSLRSVQIRFKNVVNRGVAEVIRGIRTQRAARLLKSTKHPINSIVADCGFTGPHQLARAIRKEFGLNPTELRKASSKKADSMPE